MKTLNLLLVLLLFSCQPENRVYEKHLSLSPDVEWHQSEARTFEVDINDLNTDYAFSIAFRYAQGYPWDVALISVTEVSPSGLMTVTPYSLKIRDSNGDYIGEPGYDIWDSTHLVNPVKSYYEQGTYTYTITHEMPNKEFPYAMEIGLIIDLNS